MTAAKLSEAVGTSECETHRSNIERSIERQGSDIKQLTDAIIGVPGDTSRTGMMGMLIKLSSEFSQLGDEVRTITGEHYAMQIQGLKGEIDVNNRQIKSLSQEVIEAKVFPWVKVVLASMAMCTASMGIAGTVMVLLKVKFG